MLGDVVKSRSVENRQKFREQIKKALFEVNEMYDDEIYADFDTLRGIDELGGVLSGISDIYKISRHLNNALFPEKIRFSAAVAEIDLQSENRNVAEMDGPAFHEADAMLQNMEFEGAMFRLNAHDERTDKMIANQINLVYLIRDKWTKKQAEAIWAYEQAGSQSEAADRLGVTQQTLSKRLQSINWKQILEAENILNNALADYSSELEKEVFQ